MYNIVYTKEAKENIEKLGQKLKHHIRDAVERLIQNPTLGKRLSQELTGLWSYRSGDYRIIYRLYQRETLIIILAIDHRREIYKRVSRKSIK